MNTRGSGAWFFCAALLLFAPLSAQAASSSLVWGEPAGTPSQVTMRDGGTYKVPLATPAPAYLASDLGPVSGRLYQVETAGGQTVRTLIATLLLHNDSGDASVSWPSEGSYELDVVGFPIPLEGGLNPLGRMFARILFADVAYADLAPPPPPPVLATLRFTIRAACTERCHSNVLFLPGIESSRLYAPGLLGENEIWLPNSPLGSDVPELDMTNQDSINSVYTKESSIVDVAYRIFPIYQSFIDQMNALKTAGAIADWEPLAYDWRLAYDDLLQYGSETEDGKIYYRGSSAATSSDPYIVQELKRMANTSKTGKVTIIAHSNGGLLAKRLLMQAGLVQYIDKVILVASPQLGTPQAIGGLLHGFNQALPFENMPIFLSDAAARSLGQAMPMAYNLLPSASYFQSAQYPVVTFDTSTLPDWIQQYGQNITTEEQLRSFMSDNTRPKPAYNDVNTPETVSGAMFADAVAVHGSLDAWTPPQGVQLITIAGWGAPTLATIEYRKTPKFVCVIRAPDGSCAMSGTQQVVTYSPEMTFAGDGTVIESSAQGNSEASARYWLDLSDGGCGSSYVHANILESPALRSLLDTLITDAAPTSLPAQVSTTRPPANSAACAQFMLHSPLTLGFTDSGGNYTGATKDGAALFDARGVDYRRFGDVQWLSIPRTASGTVMMQGTASGSFALDIEETSGDSVDSTLSFADIPSATSTIAMLAVNPASSPAASGILLVDYDGDGTVDSQYASSTGALIAPPAPQAQPSAPAGGGNGPPIQAAAPSATPAVVATSTATTSALETATTTTVSTTSATTTPVAQKPSVRHVAVAPAKRQSDLKPVAQVAGAAQSTGGGLWGRFVEWVTKVLRL